MSRLRESSVPLLDKRASELRFPTSPSRSKTQFPIGKKPRQETGWLLTWERDLLVFSTVLKVLLFPAYHSTDFEVHRNWMAITYSLPMSKWYFDTTSEWSTLDSDLDCLGTGLMGWCHEIALDYPPFFAYFEFLLSLPARLIDPSIVQLLNLNYDATSVVYYQRSTVIVTELVLCAALLRIARKSVDPSIGRVIAASLFLHPGFFIVDHIHFQYNGFLFGILVWSIIMASEGKHLESGILFAVLLNFKHIYMYLSPAYFIYLFRFHCMTPGGDFISNSFLSLANTVLAVFVASFGPFFLLKNGGAQIVQIFSRLFPFTRGLNHAYWAPNVWALVTAADRILLKYVRWAGKDVNVYEPGVASSSRGLVGDTVFAILPNVVPIHTFTLTILFQAIYLVKLWRTPTHKSFLTALTLCGWASFMFGWHVHEKAILLVLVPLSLMAADSGLHLRVFMIASAAGIYSLFPLIFKPSESIIKVIYSTGWCCIVYGMLQKRAYEFPNTLITAVVERMENLYLAGFVPLQAFVVLFPFLTSRRPSSSSAFPTAQTCVVVSGGNGQLEFLPLMLTSVYCSIGLLWAFVRFSYFYVVKFRE
ncbi:glycosyltransferase family 57 protein [Cantharellus anzutake]|uniref:glycosyltransferase family 57 protein n=1 Tax=Cantharellus anzutake TaxID=1750568 RepID=UPI0019035641|nr:glycosyltransferase family 57 protein [Cantharellus anzutake]KAF8339207.1 glycosyltransferase family 57 protein [Cantharellus anzutake]